MGVLDTHILKSMAREDILVIQLVNSGGDNIYSANQICEMVEFMIDNIFVKFGGQLFRQVTEIPVGSNCAPFLLTSFFVPIKVILGQHDEMWSKETCQVIQSMFSVYINELIVLNNKKFWEHVRDIYPSQMHVKKTNQSDNLASYLDLTFTI